MSRREPAASTKKKRGDRERLDWLSWQYFFALICFAIVLAAFVVSVVAGPVPWYFFIAPLMVGGLFGLAGRRASKIEGGGEAQTVPGGPQASGHAEVEFPD